MRTPCSYQDEASTDGPVYEARILEMVKANRQSLDVDFVQLSRHTTALAIWTVDAPQQMLKIFDEVAEALVDRWYKNYRANVHENIFVRMTGLPVVEHLRDIRYAVAYDPRNRPSVFHKLTACCHVLIMTVIGTHRISGHGEQ